MKKILLILSISTIIFTSCTKDTASISIYCAFSDSSMNEKKAFLYTLNIDTITSGGQPTLLDSIQIINNELYFKKEISETPILGLISFENNNDLDTPSDIFIVLEQGTIKVNIDGQQVIVSGTERNNELNSVLYALMNKTLDIRDEVQSAGGTIENVPLDADGNGATQRMKALVKGINKGLYSFTKANMNNNVGEVLFVSFLNSFNVRQKTELISLSDTTYQNKSFIKYIKEEIDYHSEKESILVGKKFLDLDLEDRTGNKTKLSTYIGKGNYVFVDFWANWCRPCLEQIPDIMELYTENREKKFDIVSISIDNNRSEWSNALRYQKMEWTQLFDAKKIASETYEFDTIPFNLLVDPDGKIIAMGLTPNELEDKLEELLK